VEEIEALAHAFVEQACAQARRASAPTISPAVTTLLKRYNWPGNSRELRNMMERAVLLCEGNVIALEHLPSEKMGPVLPIRGATPSPERAAPAAPQGNSSTRATISPDTNDERERIIRALEQCAGNQTHAAKLLGISRRTLVSRLADYAIPRPRSKRE
jgi:DNA-binding NtrC family response regulator